MNKTRVSTIKISMKALSLILLFTLVSCKAVKNSRYMFNDKPIPKFESKPGDESALKDHILAYLSENQKVESSFFEQATIENTDLLREVVHYTNYKNRAGGRKPEIERQQELGYMFKNLGVGDQCGFMGTTLFDIYKIFGFKVKRYDVIDGSWKGFYKYRDSHVFLEVYIPSLKKYITQDPTINNSVFSCETGERLSFEEIRKELYQNGKRPCFLDNQLSKHYNPKGKLSLRQKMGYLEDYYTSSIVSLRKFNGIEEVQFKLHDMGTIANEQRRVIDLNFFKKLCETCKFKKEIVEDNNEIQNFMKCLNVKVKVHGVLTASFNRKETGFLLQFTNQKKENVLYDPMHETYFEQPYFSYAYWDLNNRGFLEQSDSKYMIPVKFYSYQTNEVFEF